MVYLASGHFWFFVGRGIAMGSGFILTIAFANLLAPNEYGVYKYILASAGLISAFTLGGVNSGLGRALAKGYTNVIRPMTRYSMLWNIPAFAISISVAAYYLWNGNVQLGLAFIFVGFSMVFSGIGNITKTFFTSTGEFRLATYFGTVRAIVPVFLLIVTLLLTQNVLTIILIYFASQVGMNLITYYWSLRYIQPKVGDDFLPETKRYSVYISVLGFVQTPVLYLDQFLLWHFLGPVALATYTIAQGPSKELRTLADSVAGMAFPKLARKDAGEHIEARTVQRRTLQLFIALCLVVFFYILAAPILYRTFFPVYLDAVFYSQLISLTVLLQPRTLADTFLFAHSGIRDRYAIMVPGSIIRLVLFVALIPPYGILGAIVAAFITELISTCIIFYLYWRFERNHPA